ncbi:MAG: LD-carboxypeptidase [Candidatus Thorarchaeota archaeon]
MNPVKPTRLREGDTIGVFSPSWPTDKRQQFDIGIEKLKSWGLKVKIADHTHSQHYYSAGTRNDRLEDFHTLWADPEVRMVLMSQGGSTANQLLDGIDYDMLLLDPKMLAGISDGTTLLNAVHARTGLVTFHGPDVIWTFGLEMSHQVVQNIRSTLFDGNPIDLNPNVNWKHHLKPSVKYNGWRCLREGKATGRLLGGHIRVLANTILAGFGPDFEGSILFLEGTDSVARTHSFITALRLNGVFDSVAGVILGWFDESELVEKELNRPVSEAFLEETKGYDFPILEIGELGHNVENYVLPIGCKATVDATLKKISIDESPVV